MFFDPLYFIILAPGIILSLYATIKVKATFAKYNSVNTPFSGAEVARKLLDAAGLFHVKVVPTEGMLSDHYDPRDKVIRLSEDVYYGSSVSALAVAAHETGHALQDASSYTPLVLRNMAVPMASLGSNLSWIIIFIGFAMNAIGLIKLGILLFSGVVLFQVITLPVEFNASTRAREILLQYGIIPQAQAVYVKKVLNAAALTYVAAALTAILTLIYYMIRAGLIGRSRDD